MEAEIQVAISEEVATMIIGMTTTMGTTITITTTIMEAEEAVYRPYASLSAGRFLRGLDWALEVSC